MPKKKTKMTDQLNRLRAYSIEPEKLTLIIDVKHPLYDERVHWKPDNFLVHNIRIRGVIVPILVRKNGSLLEVADGRQRVKCAIEANKLLEKEGLPLIQVPFTFKRGSDGDIFSLGVSSNEIRRPDETIIKAKKAQRLLNMGQPEEIIANTFGVSKQTIVLWTRLLDLDESVLKAVSEGKITTTAALKLENMERKEQKEKLKELIKDADKEGKKVSVKKAAGAAGEKTWRPTLRLVLLEVDPP